MTRCRTVSSSVCFGFRAPPDGKAHARGSRSQLTKRRSELLQADCAQRFFLHLCWHCVQSVTIMRRELSIACRLIPGHTVCRPGSQLCPAWNALGSGAGRPAPGISGFWFLPVVNPDCGDQAPIPCMSAHSQKLACAFAYQSDRQRSKRRNTCGGRPSTAGSGVSQPSAAVFRQNKNTPGFLLPGAFFIRGCEKLSWYRCSWSQAGCCRHR